MKGVFLSVGVLAAVFAFVHPTRFLNNLGERLDPFRSPAVFAQQADAICADYERSVSYLQQPAMNADGMQSFAAHFLAVADREVAKLHALQLPTKNRNLAKAWIATQDRLVTLARQLFDAAQRRDMGAAMTLAMELDANIQREDELALRLGIAACSNM